MKPQRNTARSKLKILNMLSCLFTVLWDGISEKQKEVDKGSGVVDEQIPKIEYCRLLEAAGGI